MRSSLAFLVCAGVGLGLTAQIQLSSNSGGGERQPVISGHGFVVAYVALVGGTREVFTVPIGGAPVRRTTNADVRIGGTTNFDAWPSLSISDTGNQITYWNAAGVHVLDVASNTDTLVSTASVLPYAQISGRGTRVVFQDLVAGNHEVFVVNASGGPATQLTTASGPGRRLPHFQGNLVVFQKPVGAFEEVFLHDLVTNTTTGPLTTTSGRGNRYARLSHDARTVVYEALVNPGAIKEVFSLDVATATVRQVSSGSLRGDRLAAPTEDGEAFYELSAINREVQRIDLASSALAAVTASTSAGYRRISVDRHGGLAVYQAEAGGATEVFVRVLGYPPALSHYGQHGVPSTGVLQDADDIYRRTFVLAIDTSLAPGSASLLLIGVQQLALPIPNAPGNFLYVDPLIALPTVLNAGGDLSLSIASPVSLSGSSAFAQWVVNDAPANALGWVTSKGVRVDFR